MHRDSGRQLFDGRPLLFVELSMSDWLLRGGFLPMPIVYPSWERDDVPWDPFEFMQRVEALVLHGGADVSPNSYGEQPFEAIWEGDPVRDRMEIELIEAARELDKPILGVCRGAQILNVAFGGTLYQDINTQVPGSLVHRNADIYEKNSHTVRFTPGSYLETLFGREIATINSVHHQAVKDLGEGLEIEARSVEDDIIEAFRVPSESLEDPWIWGVQWHPEFQDPEDTHLLPTAPILKQLHRAISIRRNR